MLEYADKPTNRRAPMSINDPHMRNDGLDPEHNPQQLAAARTLRSAEECSIFPQPY
jgi:hypothetical protein